MSSKCHESSLERKKEWEEHKNTLDCTLIALRVVLKYINGTQHRENTFLGEFKRSAYRVSAVLRVQGDGKGGANPLSGVPSSLSAWMEKKVSGV